MRIHTLHLCPQNNLIRSVEAAIVYRETPVLRVTNINLTDVARIVGTESAARAIAHHQL